MKDLEVWFGAVIAALASLAGSALFAAFVGRMVWHLKLVLREERRILDNALWRDAVIIVFAVFVGKTIAEVLIPFLGFEGRADVEVIANGIVATVAYLGPEGALALLPAKYGGRR